MEKGIKSDIIENPLHPYTKILFDSLPPHHPKYRKTITNIIEQDDEGFDGCEFYNRCQSKKMNVKQSQTIKT
jgi:ABC-type oligopeptide transport system, ATPase component